MNGHDELSIYIKAIKLWGVDFQIDMMIEEMGELIVVLNHYKRGKAELVNVVEELADVEIVLGQMKCIFGESMVEQMKIGKLERLANLIKVFAENKNVQNSGENGDEKREL